MCYTGAEVIDMPFTIIRDDITKSHADAIVNAANTSLLMGGGVCGAIFSAAGPDELQDACDKLAPIRTGDAVITPGFKLPAKHIIHTAGPVYRDGAQGEEEQLYSCYANSLRLAMQSGCESIAFPLISSGIYGYPKAEALHVATSAIRDFISENDIDVYLVVFDKEAFSVSEKLLGAVNSYISEHYVEEHHKFRRERFPVDELSSFSVTGISERSMPMAAESVRAPMRPKPHAERLQDIVGNLDEPFSATLLRLIDATGRKDAEIYRRANIDRRLFSKIRGNMNYTPSKPTVIAFAVALELTLEQTTDLLSRAGYALSHSRKFDVIIEYFISNRKFDIYEINEVLFSYDQPLLGG
jgi:O-acetyl-ADP-ribose deacetylase (regulator of RNase III)